jgi:hypothetical protein
MKLKQTLALAALAALAGCVETGPATEGVPAFGLAEDSAPAPEGGDAALCWARDLTPAQIETVTEQVLVQAAVTDAGGKVVAPAQYRTETHQKMLRDRSEITFETPCRAQLTPEFIGSLQRALAARGLYRGPITGGFTPETRRAIRAFQKPLGVESPILSMEAARKLGLVAYARDQL